MSSIRKFTLLELLVVIAIIGILLTLLLPSLSKAREMSIRAVCLSNLKQCATASIQYAAKNNMRLNPSTGRGKENKSAQSLFWMNKGTVRRFNDYLGNWMITDCPNMHTGLGNTKANGYKVKNGSVMIGFIYSGGIQTSRLRGPAREFTAPQRLSDDNTLMLWADRISSNNRYNTLMPHTKRGYVSGPNIGVLGNPGNVGSEGGNIIYLDGAGKWTHHGAMTGQRSDSGATFANWWEIRE